MKLRILGNSIRWRLTQTEVRNLAEGKLVKEITQFGPDNFLEYELSVSNISDIKVSFLDGKIKVELPISVGEPWANGTEISLRNTVEIAEGSTLSILIEKDFKCKTERVGENESDMFPNPEC